MSQVSTDIKVKQSLFGCHLYHSLRFSPSKSLYIKNTLIISNGDGKLYADLTYFQTFTSISSV